MIESSGPTIRPRNFSPPGIEFVRWFDAAAILPSCGCLQNSPVAVAAHIWVGYEPLFMTCDRGWLDASQATLLETRSALDSIAALRDGTVQAAALTLDEVLAREGKLDPSRVTVINTQKLSAFPVKSSTMLYPEWPFSYLVHVDERLARQVTAALFLIGNETPAARAMGIRGFSVPADYTPVADVLRALRMPPFDVAPAFTWRDVLLRYQLPLGLAGVLLALILLLSGRLWLSGRRLRDEKQRVLQQQQALVDSEFRWKFAVGAAGGGVTRGQAGHARRRHAGSHRG